MKINIFLNEIEDMSSNYFTRHTKYPVIEKYAEAYYKYADKLIKKWILNYLLARIMKLINKIIITTIIQTLKKVKIFKK